MSKRILLTQGRFAIVDESDYDYLSQMKWNYSKTAHNYYARTKINGSNKYMHRIIMKEPDGLQIDHINGDTIDNRRCNLRICTNQENARNSKSRKGKSKYKGITWSKRDLNWKAQIQVNYVNYHIGYYDTEEEAALAYNKEAIKRFGEFAKINIL